MTKLSPQEVQRIVREHFERFAGIKPGDEVVETPNRYLLLYSVGYICSGNSAWDLLVQVFEGGYEQPFTDLEDVVQYFSEMDDEDVDENWIKENLDYIIDCGRRVRMAQSSTIDG
jgi:hypothetical protein